MPCMTSPALRDGEYALKEGDGDSRVYCFRGGKDDPRAADVVLLVLCRRDLFHLDLGGFPRVLGHQRRRWWRELVLVEAMGCEVHHVFIMEHLHGVLWEGTGRPKQMKHLPLK